MTQGVADCDGVADQCAAITRPIGHRSVIKRSASMSSDCSNVCVPMTTTPLGGAVGFRIQGMFHSMIQQFPVLSGKSAMVKCGATSHLQQLFSSAKCLNLEPCLDRSLHSVANHEYARAFFAASSASSADRCGAISLSLTFTVLVCSTGSVFRGVEFPPNQTVG